MNFWDLIAIGIALLVIDSIIVNILNHRQRMARIKYGNELDGKKIAEAAKEKFHGYSNSGMPHA